MRTAALAMIVLAAVLCASVFAQQQPAQAVNNQDERVNVEARAGANGRLSILRSDDKQEVQNYVSKVVELQNAAALELLPHVLEAVNLEKGTAQVLKYTPPGGGKARYFIQVVTTEKQMTSVIETIKALDLPGVESSPGDVRCGIRMKYRRASEVANVLATISLSAESSVVADDATNTIYFIDSVSDAALTATFAKFADVPPLQIEMDVQVYEVCEEDAEKLGLDWDAWKRSLGGQIDVTGNWFEGGDIFARLDGLLTIDARTLAEFLNYTAQEGHAKVVKRAKITATNLIELCISNGNTRHIML